MVTITAVVSIAHSKTMKLMTLLLCWSFWVQRSMAYPLIVEVGEVSEKCLRFNIPEDDDAHVIFLPLPAGDSDNSKPWQEKMLKMEEYWIDQVEVHSKYADDKRDRLPVRFQKPVPNDIQKILDEILETEEIDVQDKTGLQIKVSNPSPNAAASSRTMETYYFTPIVMNHVRRAMRAHEEQWEATPLEGYVICFNNMNNEMYALQMVMKVLLVSDIQEDDDDGVKKESFESKHLTPLAEELEASIEAANTVLKEMRYMEKREARMRVTADSINSRVQFFSYISVSVLLVVTYIQVTYLKRYFRKKKLM